MSLVLTHHVKARMADRNISVGQVIEALNKGMPRKAQGNAYLVQRHVAGEMVYPLRVVFVPENGNIVVKTAVWKGKPDV